MPNFRLTVRKSLAQKDMFGARVTIEGRDYSMNLLPNGVGGHWLHFKREILEAFGKQEGDTIKIQLEKNEKPRSVNIPEYLQWLLDNDPQMTKYFERMPISGKKFWIQLIEEPKNDDVKVQRINRLFEYLGQHYAGKI